MERIVRLPQKVEDLTGLLTELRRQEFAVFNVGADANGTYVYLDEFEEKDPSSVIEVWSRKPVPKVTPRLVEKRKAAEEKKEPDPKPSLFKRIFRLITGKPSKP